MTLIASPGYSMKPEFNDLMCEYNNPDGIMGQLVAEKGARRRRKSKDSGGELRRRKRKLSEEQLNKLEMSFEREHTLETERKERLAAELGMEPRQVAVWFQNRRARWKAKKMEEDFSNLRSHLHSTLLHKCCLHTQVVKMKEQLNEAEKEIQRLVREGLMRRRKTPFVGDHAHGFEWDDLIYYI